jgi:FkbM family methyltransferase
VNSIGTKIVNAVAGYRLAYDIGVQDGADSAYYLTRFERVIGVEANPIACEALRKKFSLEIEQGRYLLLNIGVAASSGEMEFYICGEWPDWSSFDRALAERGARVVAVKVPTMTSSQILAEYGAPDFLKIDIEGHDKVCLAALSPQEAPPYISVELGHPDGGELIEQLTRLGYRKFKIVSQRTMTSPVRVLIWLSYKLGERPKYWMHRINRRLRGVRKDGDWRFPLDSSSGAFGERAAGRWVSAQAAMRTWRFLKDIDDKLDQGRGLQDWFDIHAAR